MRIVRIVYLHFEEMKMYFSQLIDFIIEAVVQ